MSMNDFGRRTVFSPRFEQPDNQVPPFEAPWGEGARPLENPDNARRVLGPIGGFPVRPLPGVIIYPLSDSARRKVEKAIDETPPTLPNQQIW